MAKRNVGEKIFEAASRSFHEYGYNATGIQEIVDSAGVPKGSFYAHYKSKEALGLEVLRIDAEATLNSLVMNESSPALDSLKEHFRLLANDYYRFKYRSGCLVGDFASELASNAKFRTASLAYMNAWAAKIEEALRIAQEAKEIPKQKDPAVLSRFLLAAFFGAALRIRLLKSLVPFEEFIEIAFGDLLINSKQTAAKAK